MMELVKDSRWLQLEVCREFQRHKCSRTDTDCKFAHPPPHLDVQNGRVIACYDSIKGRCNREKPPCKYFHPPQHLKDQLLINGRNHLALKNALLQQIPLQMPAVATSSSPYLPLFSSPYLQSAAPVVLPAEALQSPLSLGPLQLAHKMAATAPPPRTDRLEVCREFQRGNCKRSEGECRFAHPPEHVSVESGEGAVTVCMDFVKGRCAREPCRYFHPPQHLQAQLKARPPPAHVVDALLGKKRPRDPADDLILADKIYGLQQSTGLVTPDPLSAYRIRDLSNANPFLTYQLLPAGPHITDSRETNKWMMHHSTPSGVLVGGAMGVPYAKRTALDKSGVPVYQPAYQQLAIQQPAAAFTVPTVTFAGHPAAVPRF